MTFCRLDLCLETSVKFSINPTFCCVVLFDLFFFLCKWFLCHFFLFASSLPVPLLHSSSFEFNEPKILISERTTHHGFYSSFKNYLGLCVRKGDEEKKPYVLFVFSPSHTISHSTPKGSRILKYADIKSEKFNGQI